MRCAAALLPIVVAGCASGQLTSDADTVESCGTTDCFFERDVRDFTVIDGNTVVVYAGPQRCPFVVELQAVACEVAFAPAIEFFQTALGSVGRLTPVQGGRVCATTRGLVLYAGIVSPSLLQRQEIGPGLGSIRQPGGFSRPTSPFERSFPVDPVSRDVCRVNTIRSITDDQLVELLAEVNAPPPPIGDGRLEVPDEPEWAEDEAADAGSNDDESARDDRE